MSTIKKIPNALKWTEEKVISHLKAIEEAGLQKETYFLGRALIDEGLYADIWKYWKKKFACNDDMLELMLRIETIFMVKLYEGALMKQMSPTVAIFSLKNNHRMDINREEETEDGQEAAMVVQVDNDTIERLSDPLTTGVYKKLPKTPAQPMLNSGK